MTQQPFPEWSDNLTREQVISVLTALQKQGHTIVFGRPPITNGWTIVGSATNWVGIRPADVLAPAMWDICVGNLGRRIGTVSSMKDLSGYLNAAMEKQGISINNPPRQVTLEASEPISNMSKITAIIGSASILALWDAYLANETFACLTDLVSLGVSIDPNIRILADNREVSTMVSRSKLTSTFFTQFKTQSANGAEVRLCNKEHDRFMLLNDDRCISPDFSLNKVSNRGTVNNVKDPTSRMAWFSNEWASGVSWP